MEDILNEFLIVNMIILLYLELVQKMKNMESFIKLLAMSYKLDDTIKCLIVKINSYYRYLIIRFVCF